MINMDKRIKKDMHVCTFTESKYLYSFNFLFYPNLYYIKFYTNQLHYWIFLELIRMMLTLSARVLWAIVLPVLLSLLYDSISAIQFSHCFRTSCLFSQKCLWMTSRKQGVGFRICSSMAHLTVACRILASYSRELAVPEGVPRDRSYPGSLKYGSDTKISDWMDTNT